MASYGSETGVEALLPAIGDFDGSSTVTTTELTAWLEQGYARINRVLAGQGYSTPVAASAAVYDELTALNNLYAAAQVLRAYGLDTATGEEENRSDRWLREFWRSLKELAGSDLTTAVVLRLTSKKRRRVRSMQVRRVDGFSGAYEGDVEEYDNTSE